MHFNAEINLGTLISLATLIFLSGGFYVSTRALYTQVSEMREELKTLNKVIMDVAVQNTRIDNLEKRNDDRFANVAEDIRELKHGDGFIKKQ